MSDDQRSVHLTLMGEHRLKATNARGGLVSIGHGEDPDFTPVELLLAAIGACSGLDVEFIAGKRATPTSFEMIASGTKVRDEHGNRLVDLQVSLAISFPEGEAGDAARAVLPRAIAQSRDRLCTVSRTVAVGAPVTFTTPT